MVQLYYNMNFMLFCYFSVLLFGSQKQTMNCSPYDVRITCMYNDALPLSIFCFTTSVLEHWFPGRGTKGQGGSYRSYRIESVAISFVAVAGSRKPAKGNPLWLLCLTSHAWPQQGTFPVCWSRTLKAAGHSCQPETVPRHC